MIREWKKDGWRVEFDSAEIFPDDPGNGTPVMVYASYFVRGYVYPKSASGTYNCVVNEGMCGDVDVPDSIMHWLESLEDEIEECFQNVK